VERHLYVHDGAQVLLEVDPDLLGTPGQCNELAGVLNRRAYGPGIDGLLWLDRKTGADIVRSYPVRDLVGSVWGLVGQGGEVTAAALEYNAWGKPSWEPGTDFGPVRYTGRDWDADEGMYYYRARWYAPELGRFLQPDPIGFAGGDLNLFAYVLGDPATARDPSGLDAYGEALADALYLDPSEADLKARCQGAGAAGGFVLMLSGPAPVPVGDSTRPARKGPTTVEDLVNGSTPGRATKGRSKLLHRKGGVDQANRDFDALSPTNVRDVGDGTRVGTLPDGRKAIVRSESSGGPPTLEIQDGKRKTKFRYGDG